MSHTSEKTSASVSRRMIRAVSARAALSRAQMLPLQPPRASPMAPPRPIPLLEPPTRATFPFSPRSIGYPLRLPAGKQVSVLVLRVSYAFRCHDSTPVGHFGQGLAVLLLTGRAVRR